jgi:hypothetical protein
MRRVTKALIRFDSWLIPYLDRARAYRLLRPFEGVIARWIFGRNLRLILRYGQIRHLEVLEAAVREHAPGVADEFAETLGDKAELVLKRDSEAWRESSDGQ